MTTPFATVARLLRDDEGQGLVEYALILVLVSVVAFATLQTLGISVSGIYTQINGDL